MAIKKTASAMQHLKIFITYLFWVFSKKTAYDAAAGLSAVLILISIQCSFAGK
jgi:hypothetical protein